jgi:hypothetical protein
MLFKTPEIQIAIEECGTLRPKCGRKCGTEWRGTSKYLEEMRTWKGNRNVATSQKLQKSKERRNSFAFGEFEFSSQFGKLIKAQIKFLINPAVWR